MLSAVNPPLAPAVLPLDGGPVLTVRIAVKEPDLLLAALLIASPVDRPAPGVRAPLLLGCEVALATPSQKPRERVTLLLGILLADEGTIGRTGRSGSTAGLFMGSGVRTCGQVEKGRGR